MEEERATAPIPATHQANETNETNEVNEDMLASDEAISRPGSTSTTTSAAIGQLPGITIMADSGTGSPQLKTANSPVPARTPTPPIAPTLAHEPQVKAEVPPPTSTTVTAPTPTLTPTSTPTPTPTQFPAYTQTTITTIPAATATATPAPAPAPTAPAQAPAPMPAPMQIPIVAPVPVTMNNHIASSPAAHAPTPSGNLQIPRAMTRKQTTLFCPIHPSSVNARHQLRYDISPIYAIAWEPGKCLPISEVEAYLSLAVPMYTFILQQPFIHTTSMRVR
ncbi:hypothetical protein F5B21DRAFT_296227 [Xylaria acuta]|nr:hypothetical protein F5B21DRAFT_296227 [Xylaria acuta]